MVRTFLKVYTEHGSYPNGYMAVGSHIFVSRVPGNPLQTALKAFGLGGEGCNTLSGDFEQVFIVKPSRQPFMVCTFLRYVWSLAHIFCFCKDR